MRHISPLAWSVYCCGICLQLMLVLISPRVESLGGDEFDYVGKATRLGQECTLCPPKARESSTDVRQFSDFRPPGFATFLAILGVAEHNQATYRKPLACSYVLGIGAVLSYALYLGAKGNGMLWQCILASLLSTFPPCFEWLLGYSPDALCALLTFFGLSLIAKDSFTVSVNRFSTLLGSGLLAISALVRPELMLTIPVCIAVVGFSTVYQKMTGVSLRSQTRQFGMTLVLLLLPLVVTTCANISYRWICFNELRVFGRLEVPCPGVTAWCKTWVNTESECLARIVWPLGHRNPRLTIDDIPARAFSNDEERSRVAALLDECRLMGHLTAEMDQEFSRLAKERISSDPAGAFLVPRAWIAFSLWFNLESNSQLLDAMSHVPRMIRRPILAFFVLVKALTLVLVMVAIPMQFRNLRKVSNSDVDRFILHALAFIVFRTVLIAVYMGTHEHRYATVAWPLCVIVASHTARDLAGRMKTRLSSTVGLTSPAVYATEP
jgi:hypothetical protein